MHPLSLFSGLALGLSLPVLGAPSIHRPSTSARTASPTSTRQPTQSAGRMALISTPTGTKRFPGEISSSTGQRSWREMSALLAGLSAWSCPSTGPSRDLPSLPTGAISSVRSPDKLPRSPSADSCVLVVVHLTNTLEINGTSMHFHGMHQRGFLHHAVPDPARVVHDLQVPSHPVRDLVVPLPLCSPSLVSAEGEE